MELLKAVNTVLPFLGEHPITRIEGARHPTVDLILASIERQQLSLLTEGWWFNKLRTTLPLNTDGMIDTPSDAISIYGEDCSVELDGEKLFNLDTGSRYFDGPIKVEYIFNKPFNRLPNYAALVITYSAAAEIYLTDYGRENTVPEIQSQIRDNMYKLEQEHLRKSKYNSQKTGRVRSGMWKVHFR